MFRLRSGVLQVQQLIAELNEILAHDVVDEAGVWKKKLTPQCLELFELLPLAIQEQLLLERDPHGNVQVNIDHGQSRFYSVLHNLITSVISAGCEN